MILFRDIVYQIKGNEILVCATPYQYEGEIPLAKSSNAPQQVVTNNVAPWEGQQHYLKNGFHVASLHINDPLTYYPDQTYASFSPQTEKALNLTEARALAGSPVQTAMNKQLQATLDGDYLYGGAGFNAAYEAAKNKILPDIQSRYNAGGRYGSGLARQAEASALGDAFASQYGNERTNQLRAMMFAPQAAQSDYNDLKALAGVGQQREGQTQSAIDENIARYNQNKLEKWQRLNNYMNTISGQHGSAGTQTTTGFQGNRGAGILGGALGGLGLASSLASSMASGAGTGAAAGAPIGPWGAGLGALAGGLLGGFF